MRTMGLSVVSLGMGAAHRAYAWWALRRCRPLPGLTGERAGRRPRPACPRAARQSCAMVGPEKPGAIAGLDEKGRVHAATLPHR